MAEKRASFTLFCPEGHPDNDLAKRVLNDAGIEYDTFNITDGDSCYTQPTLFNYFCNFIGLRQITAAANYSRDSSVHKKAG